MKKRFILLLFFLMLFIVGCQSSQCEKCEECVDKPSNVEKVNVNLGIDLLDKNIDIFKGKKV